jgi:glyoxylase I family protein
MTDFPPAALEHVNLTVRDPERSAALFAQLFGWHERWRGSAQDGGFTIHVGTAREYVALYTGPKGQDAQVHHAKGAPLNHIGVVVDDLAATEARAQAAGLKPFNHGNYSPGRRFYLFDENGIEIEVVSYSEAS